MSQADGADHTPPRAADAAERRMASVLETVADGFVALDRSGRFTYVNRSAEQLLGLGRDQLVGCEAGLLEPAELALLFAEPLEWVLATGSAEDFEAFYPPTQRWLEVRAYPSADGLSVYLRDLTSRKRDEAELRRRNAFVHLLQGVASAANEATSLHEAIRTALDEVCVHTGWEVGHAFLLGADRRLTSAGLWHIDDPPRFARFREVTEQTSFAPGEGIIGRVYQSGAPAWIQDIESAPDFLRGRNGPLGVRACIAIPLLAGRTVVGVLEFLSARPIAPDRPLLDVLRNVGTQLGRVAERVRASEMLRASEARFAGIVSIAVDAIISIDERQNVTLFNEGAERVFGYTRDEVIGRPLTMLLPDRFREHHASLVTDFGRAPEVARSMSARRQIAGRRRNGEEFPAEGSISKLDLDGQRIYTIVMRDIAERKRAEEAQRFLSDAGAMMTSSFEPDLLLRNSARFAVPRFADWCVAYSVEEDGAIRRVDVAHADPEREAVALDLLGRQLAGEWHHPVLEVLRSGRAELYADVDAGVIGAFTPDAECAAAYRRLGLRSLIALPLVARERTLGAISFVRGDSGRRYGPADLALVEELGRRLALALDNATLYRQARAAVLSRDEVLGVVSHDLANPLAAIYMAADALLRTPVCDDHGKVARNLEAIRTSAEQMERLIHDLIEVRRMEVGRLELQTRVLDVEELLTAACRVLHPLASVKAISLELAVAPDTPRIRGDRARLLQVLSNLLGNAVKFTPRDGRITLSALPADGSVRFTVTDSGPGIPPDQLPHVFERFWRAAGQARRPGIGLGLAIAQGLVEAHGGRIWAESPAGHGASFHFTLPAPPPDAPPLRDPGRPGATATAGRRSSRASTRRRKKT